MQVKHTFLFTMMLGLAWTGYLFAYAQGPDPGMNGLFGQSCTVCHSSFAVNSGNGSVTLSGLPASWTPGQTYGLTVTVGRATGSHVYGFQLSAVIDSTSQQAGTLAKVNGAVQVICGNGPGTPPYPGLAGINPSNCSAIQFAEHTLATGVNTFTVNWTAPASASVGTVRFNLAGNAGDGDGSSANDHIYTTIVKVAPAATQDPSIHPFTIVDRGGMSVICDGSGTQTS